MDKASRCIRALILAACLVKVACASDELSDPVKSTTVSEMQSIELVAAASDAATDEPRTKAGILDPRERIFYPGDTERPQPRVPKLFLNNPLDQNDMYT